MREGGAPAGGAAWRGGSGSSGPYAHPFTSGATTSTTHANSAAVAPTMAPMEGRPTYEVVYAPTLTPALHMEYGYLALSPQWNAQHMIRKTSKLNDIMMSQRGANPENRGHEVHFCPSHRQLLTSNNGMGICMSTLTTGLQTEAARHAQVMPGLRLRCKQMIL